MAVSEIACGSENAGPVEYLAFWPIAALKEASDACTRISVILGETPRQNWCQTKARSMSRWILEFLNANVVVVMIF